MTPTGSFVCHLADPMRELWGIRVSTKMEESEGSAAAGVDAVAVGAGLYRGFPRAWWAVFRY